MKSTIKILPNTNQNLFAVYYVANEEAQTIELLDPTIILSFVHTIELGPDPFEVNVSVIPVGLEGNLYSVNNGNMVFFDTESGVWEDPYMGQGVGIETLEHHLIEKFGAEYSMYEEPEAEPEVFEEKEEPHTKILTPDQFFGAFNNI